MIDPITQFAGAGFDDEPARAAFETAQRTLAAMTEAMQALAKAARVFLRQLAEALRPLLDAIIRWVRHHWRAIRAALGSVYRPETIMRKKMRRYVLLIDKRNTA